MNSFAVFIRISVKDSTRVIYPQKPLQY